MSEDLDSGRWWWTVLGLSSFVYGQTILCHPLDNSVAIPKDPRVTRVVPSFGNLNYSLASSMGCISSKCLLMKLFSHLLGGEGCPFSRLWCWALSKGLTPGSPHGTSRESLQLTSLLQGNVRCLVVADGSQRGAEDLEGGKPVMVPRAEGSSMESTHPTI